MIYQTVFNQIRDYGFGKAQKMMGQMYSGGGEFTENIDGAGR